MTAACALLSIVLASGQQSPGKTYASAIDAYVHGNSATAAALLGSLTSSQIQQEIEGLVSPAVASLSTKVSVEHSEAAASVSQAAKLRLEAAAMLHTDYAISADLDPKAIEFQIDMAHLLLSLDRLLVQQTRDTSQTVTPVQLMDARRAEAYLPRWYSVATSVLLLVAQDRNAKSLADEEVKLFPHDPRAVFAHALVDEFEAVWDPPPLLEMSLPAQHRRDPSGFDLLNETRRWGPAVAEYQEVVAAQPDNQEARLHLAYCLISLRRRDDARRELTSLRGRTTGVFVGYLADLFLARLDEDAKDDAAAAMVYQHAIDTGPEFQSAYIGLSLVEDRRGHHERARAIVAKLAAMPDDSRKRDPWWSYRTTRLPADDLLWLRAQVRR